MKKYERVDKYLWSIGLLISVVILGYWLKTRIHTPEAAELAFCFIYFDSTIILLLTFYYSSIDVIETAAGTVTKVHSGPLKVIHVPYLAVILLLVKNNGFNGNREFYGCD